MKCFWNTWAAPPAPIVVTAPQYSHTTRASPSPGLSGPPHELHFMLCGIGGGVCRSAGAVLVSVYPLSSPPGAPGILGGLNRAARTPDLAPFAGRASTCPPPPA